MIKIGPALARIIMHRPQNFSLDSQNLYALGVHGDFHLDTCLATWTRGHVSDSKSPDTSSTYICPDPRKKVSSSSVQYWPRAVACNVVMTKSAKSELNWLTINFFLFADHLPATLFNQFESISDLKENSAQSWGHIEPFGDIIGPKTSSQQPYSWSMMTWNTLY